MGKPTFQPVNKNNPINKNYVRALDLAIKYNAPYGIWASNDTESSKDDRLQYLMKLEIRASEEFQRLALTGIEPSDNLLRELSETLDERTELKKKNLL